MENNNTIHVNETLAIWSGDGEVYLACENGTIVFNADSLFNDIPHLAALALKERKKQETEILELLTKINE